MVFNVIAMLPDSRNHLVLFVQKLLTEIQKTVYLKQT